MFFFSQISRFFIFELCAASLADYICYKYKRPMPRVRHCLPLTLMDQNPKNSKKIEKIRNNSKKSEKNPKNSKKPEKIQKLRKTSKKSKKIEETWKNPKNSKYSRKMEKILWFFWGFKITWEWNSPSIFPFISFCFSGCPYGVLLLFDLKMNQVQRCQLPGHSNWIQSVAFSPDYRFLASADFSGTVLLWRTEASPQPIHVC